ncbi:MAG: acyl-CoA dehydrogenase family protein [Alphaproteobacteria bacterium]
MSHANDSTEAQFLATVDRFVRERVEPQAAAIDAADAFPDALFAEAAALGLCAMWVPERHGGLGLKLRTQLLVTERLARSSASVSLIISCNLGAISPILAAASESQLAAIMPKVASGEFKACVAMSEPGAGSDLAGITTRARREGGGYVLDGTKMWCSNGSVGDIFTVFAKTDPETGPKGVSAFLLRKGAPGFSVVRDEDVISVRGCPTTQLRLESVKVPESDRLGAEGDGFRLAMASLDEDRLNTSAVALGIAHRAISEAVAYAKERKAFGKPIIQHQGLQFLLAELATDYTTARAAWLHALDEHERGRSRRVSTLCSIAKNAATTIGMKACVEAIQVFGAAGLARALPLERMMRDAKALQIFDGTTQIHNMIIGRHLEREGLPVD